MNTLGTNQQRPDNASVELGRLARLSARESEVLSFAAMGYQDQEIVEELGISYNTLRTYWSRIRFKAGGVTRQALAAAFIDLRLKDAGFDTTVTELLQLDSKGAGLNG